MRRVCAREKNEGIIGRSPFGRENKARELHSLTLLSSYFLQRKYLGAAFVPFQDLSKTCKTDTERKREDLRRMKEGSGSKDHN